MENYTIKCLSCKGTRRIAVYKSVAGDRIDWLEDKQTAPAKIISGRKRLDDQWGFQCVCGNNDLLTAQERKTFANPASPHPQEINQIVKNLKPDKPKFEMVAL